MTIDVESDLIDDTAGIELPAMTHRPRVMPVLLLKGDLLYKTIKFSAPKYVGDPRIAVKIFNDKSCDELVLLDIMASREGKAPNLRLIEEIVTEAFMPVAYGGGVTSLQQARDIIRVGVEKIIINSRAIEEPRLLSEFASVFGVQAVVASIDVKKRMFGGYRVFTYGGTVNTKRDPVDVALSLEEAGAGEILINAIDRDGTFQGYDLELIRSVSDAVSVPVIACGGAGKLDDFKAAIHDAGASAVAAGSLFVFQLPHRAVLITFPREENLLKII